MRDSLYGVKHRMRRFLLLFSCCLFVGCAAESADDERVDESTEAVTSGKVTSARPEVGLLHLDGVRGLMGDMGWATGTVVFRRDAVLTALRPTKGATSGTFTVTTREGTRSEHRVVAIAPIEGRFALLRIDPPVPASIEPATLAVASRRSVTATFYGYGYRNVVCMPMTGSDGKKSYVTRRFDQFGGLFTGPLGVGYTCEADIGGPIFEGGENGSGALIAIDTDARVDHYDVPAFDETEMRAVIARW